MRVYLETKLQLSTAPTITMQRGHKHIHVVLVFETFWMLEPQKTLFRCGDTETETYLSCSGMMESGQEQDVESNTGLCLSCHIRRHLHVEEEE